MYNKHHGVARDFLFFRGGGTDKVQKVFYVSPLNKTSILTGTYNVIQWQLIYEKCNKN